MNALNKLILKSFGKLASICIGGSIIWYLIEYSFSLVYGHFPLVSSHYFSPFAPWIYFNPYMAIAEASAVIITGILIYKVYKQYTNTLTHLSLLKP